MIGMIGALALMLGGHVLAVLAAVHGLMFACHAHVLHGHLVFRVRGRSGWLSGGEGRSGN
jgi:hypothetical protein